MTMPAQDPTAGIALGLERLRGSMDAGFARIDGRLDVVLQRTDRAEADVRQLRHDHDQDIAELRSEVDALKDRRFPLPVVGALATVGALCLSVIGLLLTR
jgi:hypothetical protein